MKTLGKILNKNQSSDWKVFLDLFSNWSKIIGGRTGQLSFPICIKNRKLIIATGHSAYAKKFEAMKAEVLEKIFLQYPSLKKEVDDIGFRFSYSFMKYRKKKKLTPLPPSPPKISLESAFKRSQFQKEFNFLDDQELEIIFSSLKNQMTLDSEDS